MWWEENPLTVPGLFKNVDQRLGDTIKCLCIWPCLSSQEFVTMDFHMTIELTNFFKLKFHNTSIENLLLGLSSISAYNSSTVPEKMLKLWKIYPVISYYC